MSSLSNRPVESQATSSLAILPYQQKIQNPDDWLIRYLDALESVDENGPMAKLNETSISDNNGGRILF